MKSSQSIKVCLLLVTLLSISSQAGSADNTNGGNAAPPIPPDPAGSGPSSSQIDRTEVDTGESVSVENEAVAHPVADSAEIIGDAAIVVTREELAAMQGVSELSPNSAPQVHIQGEFDQVEQHGDESGLAPNADAGVDADQSEIPVSIDSESGVQSNVPGQLAGNFDGIANSGWFPPDTEMAIGQDYIVEATNSGFEIRNLRGDSLQSYTGFSGFFSSVLPGGWSGSLFDPRVIYNQDKDQFLMLVIGRDTGAQNSRWFLAVSQTSDPTGAWYLYSNSANPSDSDAWLDYPSLGADDFGVYVSGNLFKWVGGFKFATIRTINPAVYTGGSSGGIIYRNLKWNSGSLAASLQVADPHSINTNEETYLVNSFSGSGSDLLLWTLGGSRISTASSTLTKATIPLSTTYYSIGNNVDQPGTSTDLDGGDARVQNAIYANRRVFTTLTNDVGNNGTQTGILTVKLNSDTNSKEWEKSLSAANNYYFYPAVTVRGSGHNGAVGLYMSWSSASQNASSVYKVYEDPSNNGNGSFIAYKSGLASYVRLFSGRNRWGDYSGADYDWNCPGRMWGATEYAGTGNTWRTRIAGVMMDGSAECPLGRPDIVTLISPSGSITDNTPTYTWNSDPDADSYYLFVADTSGTAINSQLYTAAAAGCAGGGTCSVTPTTVIADGNATWWIKGRNAEYGDGSWSLFKQFTVSTVPPAATLISPSGTTDSTPTYTWNAVSGATWYRLWVNDTSGNPIRTWYTAATSGCAGGTGTCSITPTEVLAQGPGTWWIQTYNDAGYGPWSSVMNITVSGGIPKAPTLISPDGTINDSTPTYTWNAVSNATWYRIWVNDPTGNVVLEWRTAAQVGCSSGTGTCSYTSSTTLANGNGAWWVRGWNTSGNGPWSDVMNFILQ